MTDFNALLTRVAGHPVASGIAAGLPSAINAGGLTTDNRLAMFLGQTCQESGGFSVFEENLNYSAEALMRVWPSHFPTTEIAAQYAHKPQAIANRAYANRLGNGDEASGHGWLYRGRSAIQITGRDAYAEAGDALGLDLIGAPDQAARPDLALPIAAWWWASHGLNAVADTGDDAAVTKRVNGGYLGIAQRKAFTARARAFLAATPAPGAPTPPVPVSVAAEPLAPATAPLQPPPQAVPVDASGDPLDIPSYARSLWTAYGHRAMAAAGGIAATAAGFLHDHPAEVILLGGLAVLIALVVIVWTREREANHQAVVVAALNTPAPTQSLFNITPAEIAAIAQAVADVRST